MFFVLFCWFLTYSSINIILHSGRFQFLPRSVSSSVLDVLFLKIKYWISQFAALLWLSAIWLTNTQPWHLDVKLPVVSEMMAYRLDFNRKTFFLNHRPLPSWPETKECINNLRLPSSGQIWSYLNLKTKL